MCVEFGAVRRSAQTSNNFNVLHKGIGSFYEKSYRCQETRFFLKVGISDKKNSLEFLFTTI